MNARGEVLLLLLFLLLLIYVVIIVVVVLLVVVVLIHLLLVLVLLILLLLLFTLLPLLLLLVYLYVNKSAFMNISSILYVLCTLTVDMLATRAETVVYRCFMHTHRKHAENTLRILYLHEQKRTVSCTYN